MAEASGATPALPALLRLVVQAARAHGLDPLLVAGVVQQESAWDNQAYRAEPQIADASYGLMQTLLGTARWMGYGGAAAGLYDAGTSLAVGGRYLAYLQGHYGADTDRVLAAYNAGPGAVDADGWEVAAGYVAAVQEHLAALAAPAAAAAADVRQPGDAVPYVSQLEPDGKGYANCGPAALAMLLAHRGAIPATPAAMHEVADLVRDGLQDGNWNADTYTTLGQLLGEADRRGYGQQWIDSWDALFAALDRGEPVLLLVDNSVLQPAQYPHTPAFNAHHFVVLTAYDALDFRVNDPLAVTVRGPCTYTGASVRQAVSMAGGVQGFTLPATAPEEKQDDMTDEQKAIFAALAERGLTSEQAIRDLYTWGDQQVQDRAALGKEIDSLRQQLVAQPAPPPPPPVVVLPARVELVAEVVMGDATRLRYPLLSTAAAAATTSATTGST